MGSSQPVALGEARRDRLSLAEQQLQDLLALFDATAGYEITALHIDQAIHSLRDGDRKKADQSVTTAEGSE